MPGGDRTGPLGLGPGTGRGRGYCNLPGSTYASQNFRYWTGCRRGGMGRGFRNRFFATGIPGWAPLTPEQEVTDLKAQADLLKVQLDAIQKRMDELNSEK